MDWIQVITIIGANLVIFLTIVGLMITIHLHTDKKIQDASLTPYNIDH